MRVAALIAKLALVSLFSGLGAGFVYVCRMLVLSSAIGMFTKGPLGDVGVFAFVGGLVVVPVFVLGALVVGCPAWAPLRHTRFDHARPAAMLGALSSACGALLMIGLFGLSLGVFMLLVPLSGAVGAVIFQVLMADDVRLRPAPPS